MTFMPNNIKIILLCSRGGLIPQTAPACWSKRSKNWGFVWHPWKGMLQELSNSLHPPSHKGSLPAKCANLMSHTFTIGVWLNNCTLNYLWTLHQPIYWIITEVISTHDALLKNWLCVESYLDSLFGNTVLDLWTLEQL